MVSAALGADPIEADPISALVVADTGTAIGASLCTHIAGQTLGAVIIVGAAISTHIAFTEAGAQTIEV